MPMSGIGPAARWIESYAVYVTRTGQYAIHALLHLAEVGQATVGEIAARTGVPGPFLQRLITPLRAAGLIATRRGPGGGLTLARSPGDITLLAVVDAVHAGLGTTDAGGLSALPGPYGRRLRDIERLLPMELTLLSLADVLNTTPLVDNDSVPAVERLPPQRLLERIGHQAVTALGADHCTVYFGSDQHGFITEAYDARSERRRDGSAVVAADTSPAAAYKGPGETAGGWIALRPVGVVATAWLTGQPVAITDVEADPRASREWARRFAVRSVLAAPIAISAERSLEGWGVLIVARSAPHLWSNAEIEVALDLAGLIGLAITGHNYLTGANAGGYVPPALCGEERKGHVFNG